MLQLKKVARKPRQVNESSQKHIKTMETKKKRKNFERNI